MLDQKEASGLNSAEVLLSVTHCTHKSGGMMEMGQTKYGFVFDVGKNFFCQSYISYNNIVLEVSLTGNI